MNKRDRQLSIAVLLGVSLTLGYVVLSISSERALDWSARKGHLAILRSLLALKPAASGIDALTRAAKEANAGAVKTLLAAGVDFNKQDSSGRRLLSVSILSSRQGSVEITTMLLQEGAEINARDESGDTPLFAALSIGEPRRIEVVKTLLFKGADANARNCYGVTPVHKAFAVGNLNGASVLQASGGDLSAKDHFDMTPLHWAAWSGDAEGVKLLVSARVPVNERDKQGMTPLHRSTGRGRVRTEHLYRIGQAFGPHRLWDVTREYYAARVWRAETAKVLLAAGADVNCRDNSGATPLYYAAASCRWQMVEVLLEAGADANTRPNEGSSPLHAAVLCGEEEAVLRLLAAGADVNAKDTLTGKTPLQSIKGSQSAQSRMRKVLKAHGAVD